MSTSYYLACVECNKAYLIGQDGWKFFTFYSGEKECMSGIGYFLGEHVLCGINNVLVLSEHRVDEFNIIDWPKDEEKP